MFLFSGNTIKNDNFFIKMFIFYNEVYMDLLTWNLMKPILVFSYLFTTHTIKNFK